MEGAAWTNTEVTRVHINENWKHSLHKAWGCLLFPPKSRTYIFLKIFWWILHSQFANNYYLNLERVKIKINLYNHYNFHLPYYWERSVNSITNKVIMMSNGQQKETSNPLLKAYWIQCVVTFISNHSRTSRFAEMVHAKVIPCKDA